MLLVAVTGWGQDDDRRRAEAAGFDHHLRQADRSRHARAAARGAARRARSSSREPFRERRTHERHRFFEKTLTVGNLTMTKDVSWPTKTRELHSHHFDSTIWNDFTFRDDDIVIATYAKSGTTWMQQIIGQMLFGPDPELAVAEMSPWLDLRVPPKAVKLPVVEAQSRRRFLKTHLPVDALVFSPQAKYIYIGRDARDVVWSFYNHHANANEIWYSALNDTPGRVGPPIERPPADIRQYWREWLDGDGYPFWSFWENVRTWWQIRDAAERAVRAFLEPEARHAGTDATDRGLSRHPDRRAGLADDRRVLLVRLDEAQRHQERAARRRVLGRRRRGVHQQGRQRPLVRDA